MYNGFTLASNNWGKTKEH